MDADVVDSSEKIPSVKNSDDHACLNVLCNELFQIIYMENNIHGATKERRVDRHFIEH